MAITINKVFDANVYVNNASKHGQASQVVCPNVEAIMNEYSSLGMFGTLELPAGFAAMEATFTWTYPDNEAQHAFANPYKAVDIMVRSSKAVYNNGGLVEEQPVAIFLRGLPKQHQAGTFAGKEAVEPESALAVNYYKLEVDGEEIIEVDVINNIFKVNGEDVLAERKTNLGI
jgi:P2 family phage contractile tail tube protein